MDEQQKFADVKTLAMMAARLAGRDPQEQVTIRIAGQLIFHGLVWRYPDFLHRAERAYEVLASPGLGDGPLGAES